MKSVLLSLNPKWCAAIAAGTKTVEIRKTRPRIELPFKCYIYCTKARGKDDVLTPTDDKTKILNGKVIGEFTCDKLYPLKAWVDYSGTAHLDGTGPIEYVYQTTGLWERELFAYLYSEENDRSGKKFPGWGWHITNVKLYATPKELEEFGFSRPPQSWLYAYDERESSKEFLNL